MIQITHLAKRYDHHTVVDDVTFDVQPGRVTGFVGPNGAGKSTTMRMMVGLTRPDTGDVRFFGTRYTDLPHPARVVGAVLDARSMHPGRTARNHLRAAAALSNLPTRNVDRALDAVGLTSAATQRAGGFSLGMRQRLALAGALLGEPDVLLLDEPANGLDPDGIRWLRTDWDCDHETAACGRSQQQPASKHVSRQDPVRLTFLNIGRCGPTCVPSPIRAARSSFRAT